MVCILLKFYLAWLCSFSIFLSDIGRDHGSEKRFRAIKSRNTHYVILWTCIVRQRITVPFWIWSYEVVLENWQKCSTSLDDETIVLSFTDRWSIQDLPLRPSALPNMTPYYLFVIISQPISYLSSRTWCRCCTKFNDYLLLLFKLKASG